MKLVIDDTSGCSFLTHSRFTLLSCSYRHFSYAPYIIRQVVQSVIEREEEEGDDDEGRNRREMGEERIIITRTFVVY